MKTRSLAAMGIILSTLLTAGKAVEAATLYVSQTSPNPAPPYATWDTAAHTIQVAFSQSGPGDSIIVANDLYTNTGNTYLWLQNKSGTAASPITIQAANSGGAVLDGLNAQGTNLVSDIIFIDSNASYIVV